jgi:hypothetical protein
MLLIFIEAGGSRFCPLSLGERVRVRGDKLE